MNRRATHVGTFEVFVHAHVASRMLAAILGASRFLTNIIRIYWGDDDMVPYGSVMVSNLESIVEMGKYEVSYCFCLCYGIIRPFLKPICSILLCDLVTMNPLKACPDVRAMLSK